MQGFNAFYSPSADIAVHFLPQPNVLYRIVNAKQQHKALTVTNDNEHKLTISDYTNSLNQKFVIIPQGNRYAFVVQSTSTALCVFYNSTQNGGKIVADPGQYDSSWFAITKAPSGGYANRGYMINTFANGKSLDIEGGNTKNGSNVLQYSNHYDWNQVWLIVPADSPYQNQQNQGWGNNSGQFNPQQNINQGFQPNQQNQQNLPISAGMFQVGQTYALICAENPSKCLEHRNGVVVVSDFNGSANQKYTFEYDQTLKVYRIKTVTNSQYLNGPGIFGGADIVLKNKGDEFQFGENWNIEKNGKIPNAYSIRSFSGHAMDVPANNYSNGTKVQKHGFHGGYNQSFLICER